VCVCIIIRPRKTNNHLAPLPLPARGERVGVRGRGRALSAKAVKLRIAERPLTRPLPARRGEVSTISKVQFFRHAIELALSGKLHTAGHSILNKVDKLLESRLARLMALTGTVVGLGAWVVRAVVLVVFSPAIPLIVQRTQNARTVQFRHLLAEEIGI
jgi:hypothetical protein